MFFTFARVARFPRSRDHPKGSITFVNRILTEQNFEFVYNFHNTFTSPKLSQVKCDIHVVALHINTAVPLNQTFIIAGLLFRSYYTLLILLEKNICVLDLLRILVCDMVANARNVNSFRC